ncbi:MAG TPA: type II secretion system protein GspL [Cellvibrionaceae bacterium]|nr:type II secretion system protein GspL [Cellvibrionaceae bacterium]HMW47942.1 type II secretion system protein GspL [Cellvibrionaceae bacterium]HMW70331.1 type II secretion system protein GspL [Cellvibrionaceae bacterium]
MSERIYVRKLEHNLWQWRHVTPQGQWASESFYTGDINLLAESVNGKQVVLLLPGQNAVSMREETDLKDRKLISKVLPFQVEEHIIDSLDDLVFAYSPVKDGALTLCYVNEEYARASIDALESRGALVQRVLVDYLELAREDGSFTLILEHDQLMLADDQGSGFCVELALAPLVLKSLFAEREPPRLVLVAEGEAELAELKALLPESVLALAAEASAEPAEQDEADDDDLEAPLKPVNSRISEEIGGFWDYVLVQAKPAIDFRQGPLARKLPFAQWFKEWRIPAAAAVIAFGLAMLAATLELTTSRKQYRQYVAERDGFYRQIIPGAGNVVDPVKTLKAKLGGANQSPGSNLVGILNNVGPAISAHKDVKVSSFRYTHENRELQLNLEARDIATLEAVRNQIAQTGLKAEIKRASVAGEVNQALMRITEG